MQVRTCRRCHNLAKVKKLNDLMNGQLAIPEVPDKSSQMAAAVLFMCDNNEARLKCMYERLKVTKCTCCRQVTRTTSGVAVLCTVEVPVQSC